MAEPIRPAATLILWREGGAGREVLMGMRGAQAAFMPSKYVFPGGAVDPEDHSAAPKALTPSCEARLILHCPADAPNPATLAAAGLRELTEETGLSLPDPRPGDLRFVFRAITPPGRSRRFDARFFLVPATRISGDVAGFAATELSHLHWIGLDKARALDLPFITEVVLSEITALLRGQPDQGVPFFDNSTEVPTFRRL